MRKRKQELRDLRALKHLSPIHRAAMLTKERLEFCGEIGHYSTNEGIPVIPSQKAGPTKGLYLPPGPSPAKRV